MKHRQHIFNMVAKTMFGLEEVLAQELLAIGANNLQIGNRMVSFDGDLALLYKANLHCRTALRILKPIYTFTASTTDDIYKKVKKMNWAEHLSLDNTFAIDSVCFSDYFPHTRFVTYRVKDAIADYFTAKYGERPSVSTQNPDLYIHIHISHNVCTLSFDSSGESLHKRGYRIAQTAAPLNEVLAAGIILKTGWKGECDLIDPMCGSGTFAIEAALIACNIPPGIFRQQFAFEKWKNFDAELFKEIYNDDSDECIFKHKIIASDIDKDAIEVARRNIKSAGVDKYITLATKDMQTYTETCEKKLIVINPPYGDRLKPRNITQLYQMIGERLKHAFINSTAWILSHQQSLFKEVGLKHSEKLALKNGAIPCELRKYDIFPGKHKDYNNINSKKI